MGKTVLITGTSSGIGKATAKEFASKGWNVIATMRNPEKEKELSRVNNIIVQTLDVQKPESINSAIDAGIRHFGKIDVLINNAGQGLFGIFEATPTESIRKLFEINVFGAMNVIRAVLPHFRKQQRGMIVNISSSTGLFTIPLLSVYSASKYALEGFSESLSYELAAQNIKVKLIEPGMVDTNFDNTTRDNYLANPCQDAYSEYFEKMIELFSKEEMVKVTSADAADLIFNAVIDGTNTLRYIIGADVQALVAMRNSMNDQEYIDQMRQQFSV